MVHASCPHVLVDLDVLIGPADEDHVAEVVRSSVSRVAPGPTYALGEPTWADAMGSEDLIRQWGIEHASVPLGERRVRRLTMGVEGDGVADLVDEVAWASVEAIGRGARAEDRRVAAGEPVEVVADEFPWSSATRVVDASEDE